VDAGGHPPDPRRATLHGTTTKDAHAARYAPLTVAVTVGVHLAGRRTVLSVGIGTAVYVVLLNAL
jgi:branched-subunit amino acid transport protein AzlD